ncbi:MAG: rRNA maturation RNase YbeY [Bacteroidaceae bacterium]|nr:rRNA maturation RNase YbeY [Bacteroidaceae bacterium]
MIHFTNEYRPTHGEQPTEALLPIDERVIAEWVNRVATDYGYRVGTIDYVFVDDERILEVNRQFLQHDYYTDIITFDNTTGHTIHGDLFISLDTVRSNATLVGATYPDELHRVIIHGILHLCGINDKGPGEREVMEAAEDRALAMLRDLGGKG